MWDESNGGEVMAGMRGDILLYLVSAGSIEMEAVGKVSG